MLNSDLGIPCLSLTLINKDKKMFSVITFRRKIYLVLLVLHLV